MPYAKYQLSAPAHVLVVDDSAANRKVLASQIRRMGGDAFVVSSGSDAVEACRKKAFSLIVLDLAMPELDGIATVGLIRDAGVRNQATPIVALTAQISTRVRKQCEAAGFDAFATKPIGSKELHGLIERHSVTPENPCENLETNC